jgi:Plasmid pRiA4b ORF-3-like protein
VQLPFCFVTGRDPDPAELHRRFDELIAGMDLDDLKELAGQLLSLPGRIPTKPEQRPSLRKPRRSEPAILRVRVDLEGAKPPIWRRLDVRSDIGLDMFHQVLQSMFGWTDSHLHRFALGGSPFDRNAELFLCPYDVEEGEDDGTPAKHVRLDETLSEPGDLLEYCYDYGDSWDLIIALESVIPLEKPVHVAVCIDGRRAAPPEDCGGLREAVQLAEVLEDPAHFDLDEINQALMDPYLQLGRFDQRLVELLMRLRYTSIGDDVVVRLMSLAQRQSDISAAEKAEALRPFLWFLDHVGAGGLPLTSAGYLKPDDVRALAVVIPAMADWIGAANRESQTFPVLWFRESVQKLGLVRKYRAKLLLTKAGASVRGDAEALWRYIASRLPLGKAGSMDLPAGLLALASAASSPADNPPLGHIAEALNELGWRHPDRSPVDANDIRWAIEDTFRVLDNIRTDPRSRRLSERHKLSAAAAELAREALLDR